MELEGLIFSDNELNLEPNQFVHDGQIYQYVVPMPLVVPENFNLEQFQQQSLMMLSQQQQQMQRENEDFNNINPQEILEVNHQFLNGEDDGKEGDHYENQNMINSFDQQLNEAIQKSMFLQQQIDEEEKLLKEVLKLSEVEQQSFLEQQQNILKNHPKKKKKGSAKKKNGMKQDAVNEVNGGIIPKGLGENMNNEDSKINEIHQEFQEIQNENLIDHNRIEPKNRQPKQLGFFEKLELDQIKDKLRKELEEKKAKEREVINLEEEKKEEQKIIQNEEPSPVKIPKHIKLNPIEFKGKKKQSIDELKVEEAKGDLKEMSLMHQLSDILKDNENRASLEDLPPIVNKNRFKINQQPIKHEINFNNTEDDLEDLLSDLKF